MEAQEGGWSDLITQTSLDSWIAEQPSLAVRQAQVFRCIMEREPICNKDISVVTGLPINTVTTSVFSLREKGLVKEGCEIVDRVSGRTVSAWVRVGGKYNG